MTAVRVRLCGGLATHNLFIRHYSRKPISLKLPDLDFSTPKKQINFCDKCPPPDRDTPYTRLFPAEHEDAIDYKKSMPAAFHLRHLLISTGSHKWPKAIEKDEGTLAGLIAEKRHEFPLRSKMAKAGILISNTTLPSEPGVSDVSSAYLFPDNLFIPEIPHPKTQEFLDTLLEQNDEIRAIKLKENFGARDNSADLWLVCGHAERDARCGDIGPLILGEMDEIKQEYARDTSRDSPRDIHTALISHIGGHAFAGNVLLFSGQTGSSSWFGRVRPEHIQGLVKEWNDGRIVKELYRGSFAD
ncbi:Sucrase/ferredoxin-like-domain-containing protein [Yarrowia lipolytica]|jgi:hypothetical protein|uniref:Altered inheritance of mitochondria protein 32 n=2 Tax=Yarrowia lipolytica TaxID=4952 RepID=Q6CAH8_YARLI|nr:YALI0D02651p [Yarrowia lipolytica CLIB122]AOW03491.1 hypothetical protein YALI1_D03245g [Yarrowia lipolytica]KAB8284728.1 Sucrase/ferredoxin-like-domain-containing protein [Yarrowia lipolytica]KAE8170624.1 Sucrase/ferredoxin-like-domain-containing protein [Yarrowia lipolytica]KAJ8054872.1 Sucrase/ferredoxin-like-domain-containing protein [Yarrowia lipolytica]QNP97614.1 Altered inheritance of mitochondria protein 32 [Yarrowia lipolytica]|eukprot:XP_502334.1 YALI0D02651p [Yarrowia lipolytica CLIB122]